MDCSIAIGCERARPWPTCGCFHVSFCITSIDASNIWDGMKFKWNMLEYLVWFVHAGNWHFTSSKMYNKLQIVLDILPTA